MSTRELLEDRRRAIAEHKPRLSELRDAHKVITNEISRRTDASAAIVSDAIRCVDTGECLKECGPICIRAGLRILRNPSKRLDALLSERTRTSDALLQNTPSCVALRAMKDGNL